MSQPQIITQPSLNGYKSRRFVHLLDVEPQRCPSEIHGYGYATVAYLAGVKVESAIKAATRGLFSLKDLRSVARYILRADARRKSGLKSKRRKREQGEAIQARIRRQVVP